MPLIVELLEQAGTGWEQIGRIAVGTGPGTFTGLRIGVASARALALAHDIPLVGVSTLESLALSAVSSREGAPRFGERALRFGEERPADADVVLAVLDARRHEVFAAAWSVAGGTVAFERPLLSPAALAPAALAQLASSLGSRTLAIGDGAVGFRAVLERSDAAIPEDRSPLHRVTALGHVERARSVSASDPEAVVPQYLRPPDAELARSASRKP